MKCLSNLGNKYKFHQRKKESAETLEAEEEERFNGARAFLELAEYIENSVVNGTSLFPLPELHSPFENRLSDIGYPGQIS